ncbi:MAG TPA: hypothetical protein VG057_19760 [Solirubrobacteraceae bacterium]|jgi:hypothetical protein|nr:hypothetical protein [Solirubrobacteraceae bacterium]
MVVALTALFFAIGGVGYAAVSLPRNSVGNAQLQNGSVGNWKLKSGAVGAKKIINGSVGAKQVDSSQVQLRVASACSTGAISAVGLSGSVTCRPTVGNEYGSNTAATTLGASATQVATQSLAAGSSYLVMAYPHVVISGTAGAPQRVEVACTLSVPAGTGTPPPANPTTTTKTLAVDLAADGHSQAGSIPLVLPVASSTSVQPATVSCSDTPTPSTPDPTVAVDTTISAIQTASNN